MSNDNDSEFIDTQNGNNLPQNEDNNTDFAEEHRKLKTLKYDRSLIRSKNTRLVNQLSSLVTDEPELSILSEWRATITETLDCLHDMEEKIKNLTENLQLNYENADIENYNKYMTQSQVLLIKIESRITDLASANQDANLTAPLTTASLSNSNLNNASKSKCADNNSDMNNVLTKFMEVMNTFNNNQSKPCIKPVKVPLPEFDPDTPGASFKDFKFQLELYFQQHASSIAEDMKPFYLRQHVKGKAALMVQSIPSNQSYTFLMDLLERAYSHERKEKHEVIKQLINLEYKADHSFYANISSIVNIMKLNKMSIEDVQRHFAWSCLPIPIRNNIKSITGNQDPTLDEIIDNIFDAQRLLNENNEVRQVKNKIKPFENKFNEKSTSKRAVAATNIQKQETSGSNKKPQRTQGKQKGGFKPSDKNKSNQESKSKPRDKGKSSNNSNNATPKKPFCSLCYHDHNNYEHFFDQCSVYSNYDARLKRIRELDACEVCGFMHTTKNCKIVNPRCFRCQGNHTMSMCNKPKETQAQPTQQSAGVAVCAEGTEPHASLLPSLCANVNNQVIHALLDSGCQTSFIRESIVHEHNLPILKDRVPLTINGVNTKKDYIIKQVKVPIKIAGQMHEFICFTLPEIDLSIKVPGVKELVDLVQSFDCKLADRTLFHVENDKLAKFDLIIGISDLTKLKLKTAYLGNACVWEVGDLTILFGDVDSMISDLAIFKYNAFCDHNE